MTMVLWSSSQKSLKTEQTVTVSKYYTDDMFGPLYISERCITLSLFIYPNRTVSTTFRQSASFVCLLGSVFVKYKKLSSYCLQGSTKVITAQLTDHDPLLDLLYPSTLGSDLDAIAIRFSAYSESK